MSIIKLSSATKSKMEGLLTDIRAATKNDVDKMEQSYLNE